MRKLHKIFGLTAGIFLFVLAFSGFFLNHESWRFLHNTTFSIAPKTAIQTQLKSYEAIWINPNEQKNIIIGGKRGLFESKNKGKTYTKILDATIFAIREYKTPFI